jgi:hypothetical protein
MDLAERKLYLPGSPFEVLKETDKGDVQKYRW